MVEKKRHNALQGIEGKFLRLNHWSSIDFEKMEGGNQKCLRSGLRLMGKIQGLWTEIRQMGGEATLHTVCALLSNTKSV